MWPAWRWSSRSIGLARRSLGKHEVWYWLVAWACCGGLAYAILQLPPTKVFTLVFGLIALAVFVRRLELGIVAVMVFVASFIHHASLPKLALGGMGPNSPELLVIIMLGIVFLHSCRHRKVRLFQSPITLPLLLLYVAVMMSMVESFRLFKTRNEADLFSLSQIYSNARPMFYYAFFFVVAFGIQTQRQLRFVLRTVVWIGAIVSVMIVLQSYLGPHGKNLFIGGQFQQSYTESFSPDQQEIARSIPPGLAPICIFFLVTIAAAGYQKSRAAIISSMAAVILGVGVIFSFYRSFMISSLLGIFIMWLASGAEAKRRLMVYGTVVVLVTVLGTITIGTFVQAGTGSKVVSLVTLRFVSLFTTETYAVDESYRNRVREDREAIENIKRSPIIGIGSGTPRQYLHWTRPGTYTQLLYPIFYIHNSYLELWEIYGLLGIVSFLWISIAFLIRSFVVFRRVPHPSWKAVAIGCFAGYIGFLIRSITQPHIMHDVYYIVTAALVWGIIEVISRLHDEGQLTEGNEDPVTSASSEVPALPRPGARLRGRVGLPQRAFMRGRSA